MRFEDSKLRHSFQVSWWQLVYGARCCSLLSSNFFFLSRAVKLARFVDRTVHEGNSTSATFPSVPQSCPPRSDDALLMKLGGEKGLEGIWSFAVLNLEEFLVLLFKSGYLHSLACWLLMCLPGALLTYYCAVAVRNLNLREEIDQHQHEDTLEKLDSMRAQNGNFRRFSSNLTRIHKNYPKISPKSSLHTDFTPKKVLPG